MIELKKYLFDELCKMRAEAEKRTMDFCKKEQLGLLPPPMKKCLFLGKMRPL